MTALKQIHDWPVQNAAAGWTRTDGKTESAGQVDHVFSLASVTKPLFAYAVLVAIEEGSLSLDQPAGPPGSTIAHLLSHSSGLAPESKSSGGPTYGAVGTRRIYSNQGFEELAGCLAGATGMDPREYFMLAVAEPLGMSATDLPGSAAHGATSTVLDLLTFCRELMKPTLIDVVTLAGAVTPFLPEVDGVLPGFGRQTPNPWGLGFEIRATKSPHWTGLANSTETYGHFGASGTFLWYDPKAEVACVVLTDRRFGPWAAEAWPVLSDAVITESAGDP